MAPAKKTVGSCDERTLATPANRGRQPPTFESKQWTQRITKDLLAQSPGLTRDALFSVLATSWDLVRAELSQDSHFQLAPANKEIVISDEPFSMTESFIDVHTFITETARERRFFPLFYCTDKGVVATRRLNSFGHNTLQFEVRDGSLEFATAGPLKNPPGDSELSFEDLVSAQSTFLMYHDLFLAVQKHNLRYELYGRRASGLAPNIAVIDEKYLIALSHEIREDDLLRKIEALSSYRSTHTASTPSINYLKLHPCLFGLRLYFERISPSRVTVVP